ncbi:hypothetical protein BOX15_Mlig001723g1 [Macrostomum lignano]|uniref:Uncharacterized protein n=1 Tax=Macrostomum lignano TaxID=282301 RepID=A0A267DK18_9PLAT|nr:hypothetical protein BOX15_Mlig001723g1 [Macrostomum lignano]
MRNRSFANPTTGSSEKKKRNPLTKLAVDSIDAAATDLSASNSGEQLIVYERNAGCQSALNNETPVFSLDRNLLFNLLN